MPVPARFDRSPEHGYAGHVARAEPLRIGDGVPQHVGLLDQIARRYGSTVDVNTADRQRYFPRNQAWQPLLQPCRPAFLPTDRDRQHGELCLQVTWDDQQWTFPGGIVEPRETLQKTLIREVAEEACARVLACRYLACQHMADPLNPDGVPSYYQTPGGPEWTSTRGSRCMR